MFGYSGVQVLGLLTLNSQLKHAAGSRMWGSERSLPTGYSWKIAVMVIHGRRRSIAGRVRSPRSTVRLITVTRVSGIVTLPTMRWSAHWVRVGTGKLRVLWAAQPVAHCGRLFSRPAFSYLAGEYSRMANIRLVELFCKQIRAVLTLRLTPTRV